MEAADGLSTSVQRALGEWARSNSPVSYWYNKIVASYTYDPEMIGQGSVRENLFYTVKVNFMLIKRMMLNLQHWSIGKITMPV